MKQSRVARRYAEALMGSAVLEKNTDLVAGDLLTLRNAANASRDFSLFLKSQVIGRERKQAVFGILFEKTFQPLTMQFLNLLSEKGREDVLLQMTEEFFHLDDERRGIVAVDVRAAAELSKEHSTRLQKKFEAYTGKQVRIATHLDGDLKGGFVARVGDTVFDGSIRRQLELMRERFTTGER